MIRRAGVELLVAQAAAAKKAEGDPDATPEAEAVDAATEQLRMWSQRIDSGGLPPRLPPWLAEARAVDLRRTDEQ
ncbi:MAG: hypothetical protein K0U78_14370 [Actinomycetia bacterium]|nr:hypothetical protein [Actinomycetes bacterium]